MNAKFKYILTIFLSVLAGIAITLGAIAASFDFDVYRIRNAARLFVSMLIVENRYVDQVNSDTLVDGAIDGMVKSLGDPHSTFLDDKKYEGLMMHNQGTFGGIGVVMGFRDGKTIIMSVMENNPGEAAGLKVNDEIVAVDGNAVVGMMPDEIANQVRGEKGTKVILTIHREGEPDTDYEIIRDNIPFKTAAGQMLADSKIGYIRIASFAENTSEEFKTALDELKENGMEGLVIDVRANPGGLVTSCVDIANLVVPAGDVVSIVNRFGEKEVYTSSLQELPCPMVILVDENSASASEILAGALQDTGAATVVGTKTYGKGSVQVVVPMLENTAIKLTIAKYYTPNGRSIDGIGVEPDVEAELSPESGVDNQMLKAMEVVKDKMNNN